MAKGFKIALAGFDAETNTDPNNFSLYVDQITDYILIKEKSRATISVSTTTNIAHGLSYIPMCFVFAETASGVWRKLFSRALDSTGLWFEINLTNLVLRNTTGSAKDFSYHIFYDNIT